MGLGKQERYGKSWWVFPLKIERTLHSFSVPIILPTAQSSGGLQKRKERYVCCVRYGKYLSQVFFSGEEDVTRHVLRGGKKPTFRVNFPPSFLRMVFEHHTFPLSFFLVSAPDPPEWFSTHHHNHSHLSFLNRLPRSPSLPHLAFVWRLKFQYPSTKTPSSIRPSLESR